MLRGGVLLSLLSLFSVVACSSSRESSGVGGACANYAAALRDSAKECGHFNISPARESEYIGRFEQACQNALNAPGSGLTAAAIDQCANAVRTACGDDDACEDLFDDVRGTLAEGAPCDADYQCASGQCSTDGMSSVPGCGKCIAAVPIGAPCPQGGCVAGAICQTTENGTSSTSVCVAWKTANEGESCGNTFNGTSTSIRCASGLFCKYETSTSGSMTTGTCAQPVGEGSACGNAASGYAHCKAPFACVAGRCGKLLAADADCEDSGDCQSGLACDRGTKKCAAIVWGGTGSVCDDSIHRCERGFCRVDGTTGDTTAGTCVAYTADGEPCDAKDNTQRCDSLSHCREGICQLENPATCK